MPRPELQWIGLTLVSLWGHGDHLPPTYRSVVLFSFCPSPGQRVPGSTIKPPERHRIELHAFGKSPVVIESTITRMETSWGAGLDSLGAWIRWHRLW
jgi:hypothetical protein